MLALFDMGTVLLLVSVLGLMKLPRSGVILYAWHPLAICELVARGHLDSIGIFFMVLALRLLLSPARAGAALSGAALALSILAKGYAVLAAPFLFIAALPRRGLFLVSMAATAALAYAPFAAAGPGLFRGALIYERMWRGNASLFAIVDVALQPVSPNHDALARAICGLAAIAWVGALVRRGLRPPQDMGAMSRLGVTCISKAFCFAGRPRPAPSPREPHPALPATPTVSPAPPLRARGFDEAQPRPTPSEVEGRRGGKGVRFQTDPKFQVTPSRLSLLAMIGFFLLSPMVYPWYLAWTLPWLALAMGSCPGAAAYGSPPLDPARDKQRVSPAVLTETAWLLLTGTIFAFYAHDFAGHHREIWWVTVAEYAVPLVVALAAGVRGAPGRPSAPMLRRDGPNVWQG
jgi:hypothetical protein